jgi:hypothetical protein
VLPVALVLAVLLTGCAQRLPELPPSPGAPEPEPAEVETAVFFLGDAGKSTRATHPVLHVLQDDVERWSGALGRDSSVAVVFLGDIVYPDGLHEPGHPKYHSDSLYVAGQVGLVSGPAARGAAHGWFVAGNHDWGLEEEWPGRDRLNNLDHLLTSYRERGVPVSLEPAPGDGGPVVVDLGNRLRLLLIDTAWWLLDATEEGRTAFLERMKDAFDTAGDRYVVLASHHPYESAGSHAGAVQLWKWFGVRTVLNRSGAILQDLSSRPYRRLREEIRQTGRPFLHAGGHDHSLQVIRSVDPGAPEYTVISGSGSKLTDVGHTEGLLMRRSWPGYARLLFLRDGGVILSMVAAERRYLACQPGPDLETCMRDGTAAFRTIWSARIDE